MNDIPVLTPEKIITKISNKKTGEVYEDRRGFKSCKYT
jgi:hypothetical protein